MVSVVVEGLAVVEVADRVPTSVDQLLLDLDVEVEAQRQAGLVRRRLEQSQRAFDGEDAGLLDAGQLLAVANRQVPNPGVVQNLLRLQVDVDRERGRPLSLGVEGKRDRDGDRVDVAPGVEDERELARHLDLDWCTVGVFRLDLDRTGARPLRERCPRDNCQ